MNEWAQLAGELLETRGWRVAVAESCTGGLVGHLITGVPGSSAYFLGGVIAYDNQVKTGLLGVRETSLIYWGAVSSQVAAEMASGVRGLLGAGIGLSVTGIAGPGGGSPGKPVGLTYLGIATRDEVRVWRHVWQGSREENKSASAEALLRHLYQFLSR